MSGTYSREAGFPADAGTSPFGVRARHDPLPLLGKARITVEAVRLTPDQLAALAPGDAVCIESGAEFGRARYTAGTVTRITGPKVFVRVESARGVPYVQQYSLRDGWRVGPGRLAALVTAPSPSDRTITEFRHGRETARGTAHRRSVAGVVPQPWRP